MLGLKLDEKLSDHIKIAVGWEDDSWYVQTTDVQIDTYYSEPIEYGLQTKAEALAIANHYAKKLGLEVEVWDQGKGFNDTDMAKMLTDMGYDVDYSHLDNTFSVSLVAELAINEGYKFNESTGLWY